MHNHHDKIEMEDPFQYTASDVFMQNRSRVQPRRRNIPEERLKDIGCLDAHERGLTLAKDSPIRTRFRIRIELDQEVGRRTKGMDCHESAPVSFSSSVSAHATVFSADRIASFRSDSVISNQ